MMLFLGLIILAGIGIRNTDVSLLPDLDIPVMIVQLDIADKSPEEVEAQALAPMRRYLLTMNGIEQLTAESSWGHGEIRITFAYGWDMNKAFIETNEKVDLSLSELPKSVARPRVIKTRAEDLPSYLLTLRQRSDDPAANFLHLSEFAREVLRRRLEQIEEIALVDMHGAEKLQVEIIPDEHKLAALGLDQTTIQQALDQQNVPISSIRLKERNYEYLVQIGYPLHSMDRLKTIKIVVGDRVLPLSQIADIQYAAQPAYGAYVDQGQKAISLAIIKTPRSSLNDLKTSLAKIIDQLERDFPGLVLELSRDQTRLLEVTLENLYSSLLLGCLLAIGIVFFFYGYWRLPVLMAIVIPVSLLITLLGFKAVDVSINMLSLSGILLGLGLMIDNGIIVLDNISQAWSEQDNLATACIRGTNEMIRPLLTSMLTTCSVFIPLMFLSGLAGALFWDQALAVSMSLLISYLVSILLLPTLYFTLIHQQHHRRIVHKNKLTQSLERWYRRSINLCLNHKTLFLLALMILCLGVYPIGRQMKTERFPTLPEEAIEVEIDWNEPIRPEIAVQRLADVMANLEGSWQAHLGERQYLLNNFYDGNINSAEILFRYKEESNPAEVKAQILQRFSMLYPDAMIKIKAERTAFHMIFPEQEQVMEMRCYLPANQNSPNNPLFQQYLSQLKQTSGDRAHYRVPADDKSYLLQLNLENTLYYEVDQQALLVELKRLLGHHEIAKISSFQYELPVIIKANGKNIDDVLAGHSISNKQGQKIPLRQLVTMTTTRTPRSLYAGMEGPYVPIWVTTDDYNYIDHLAKRIAREYPEIKLETLNPIDSNWTTIQEIIFALLASILLLYFLMAAQFESLILPVIILLEIPISLAGALLFLWLFEASINVMSAIGMVVTIGIIINDSIIKIDTIERAKRTGMGIRAAIHYGGLKRLNPIIMTSLTTILAVLPFLWGEDLGRMLQRPLALSLIGGMLAGTLVSLLVIPLLYELSHKKL